MGDGIRKALSQLDLLDAGFCLHCSEVVGPNHHSAFIATTQATFTTTHIVDNNTKLLLFIKLDCHLAKCNHHSDHPGQNPVDGVIWDERLL